MIIPPYFEEYIDLYERGIIPFNKERILLVDYLKEDVLTRDDIYFNHDQIEKYVKFTEKNFFPLAKYQKFITPFIFLYSKENDEVFFDEFLITIARGGGKNGFMSSRDAFFISPLYGIENYDVTITANSEKQGKVSFKEVYEMVQKRGLERQYYLTKMAIKNNVTNSIFSFRTNNPKTMDSARDGTLEFDEIHQFETSDPVDIQRSGLGKIENPRTFYNGTNGHYREGFYDRIIERSLNILNKKAKNDRLFPFICRLDTIEEMKDPIKWSKANPMFEEDTPYSKRLWTAVMKEYKKLEDEPSGRNEFIVKRMNFTHGDGENNVTSYNKLLKTAYSDIENKILREIPDLTGHNCIAGFDYASFKDFASIGLLFKTEDGYFWKQHSFIRQEYIDMFKPKIDLQEWVDRGIATILDEPSIDPKHYGDWLDEQSKYYNIELVVGDGYRMDVVKPILEERGYEYEFLRNAKGVQARVANAIEDGFENERFIFGNDPSMRWYVNNTFVKEDSMGNKAFLKKEPKRRKTDGFHAFIAAFYKRELLDTVDVNEMLDFMESLYS